MRAEWPLVGRDGELRSLTKHLVERRRGVVLAGPAGVGKSRLLSEALEVCRSADSAVAGIRATRSSAEIPLAAFATLLPSTTPAQDGHLDEKMHLLQRCAEHLTAAARARPLVLGIDDAHLLDDMSATLVHQLAASDAAAVVVTVRSGEVAPDPVTALWKDGLCERIDVAGLSAIAVARALTGTLEAPVDEAAVAELTTRSRGNMLFLRDLVRGALADGVLRNEGGLWRLVGELHPTDRLVELVEARLQGLTGVEREMLELVAFGEPISVAELGKICDLGTAENLERTGLLTCAQEGSRLVVRLGHPIYGDVLRLQVQPLRARTIARSLAESVESAGNPQPEDLLRIATWRLAGGGAEPTLMYDAAVVARWRYDFGLAERLARAAVEAGGGIAAALLAAQLAGLQGRPEQADAELSALAEAMDDADDAGLVALIRLDNRVIYAGKIDDGLKIADDAAVALAAGELRDEIAARRAALLLAKEGPRRAVAALQPILDRADGKVLAWACMPGSYSLARLGRIDEALTVAQRGYQTHSALPTTIDWYPCMHAFYEAEALAHAGRFGEARDLATDHYRQGVTTRSLEAQAIFSWQLAKTVADRGHVDEAVRLTQRAVSIYRQLGRPQFVAFCLIYQAQALATAGRDSDADETMRSLESLGIEPTYFMGVDLLRTQAWIAVAKGNLREARDAFLHAGADGERIGDLVGALAALHDAARVGYPGRAAARMAELAGQVEGVLAGARWAHVQALVAADGAALETVSADFEAMGALLVAAESAADAAVAWGRAGDRRRAAAARQRVGWLAAQCPGARTPALLATESRARLTPAEREAALLAAAGQSNRQIARQLVVSVRTVENRLQHVYGKLGVSSRSALTGALVTAGEQAGDPTQE